MAVESERDHYELTDIQRERSGTASVVPEGALDDPSLYLNRELSWLDFNDRVLQLGEDARVPLLERVKFCAIYTTNLDEFYMVRVAGLRDQIDAGVETRYQDGRTPSETIALIRERILAQGRRLTDCFEGELRGALAANNINVVGVGELEVSDDAADLLQAVEDELRRRRFGEIVRVEVSARCSERLLNELTGLLRVDEDEVYAVDGLLDMGALWQLVRLPGHSELRDPPLAGITHPRLVRHEDERPDVLAAMREGDLLVHHPYISFATSVERFVEQAVADPNVLAIKQTVYRTSDDSPLVPALIHATERGKQAVALVELQARFDEGMNIHWAKALEEAGVHVVYGQPALKTHVKCVLVVRREGDGVRNYVHIGTGNYHSATARLYTDFGLFTTDEQIGADVADMFNYLTGYGRPTHYRKVLMAPNQLREGILDQIERTIAAHSEQFPARIAMKMNALVDGRCIRALYRASQAGVRVDLNVRGICCLRPGLSGVSEDIRVVSIVGRLLEHSRVYAFERADEHTVYIASADLMPRNLDHRVELATPILAPGLQAELLDTHARPFADNQNAWKLDAEGAWTRRAPAPGEPPRSLQLELAELYAGRPPEQWTAERQDLLALEAAPVALSRPRPAADSRPAAESPAVAADSPVAEPRPWEVRRGSL